MSDAAQYTLGLFDSTALGGTLMPPPALPIALSYEDETADATAPPAPAAPRRGDNVRLAGERILARGWPARARDNIAAIELSNRLDADGRAATAEEQERLLRFIGFCATELAQNVFPLPGETGFRPGWAEIGAALPAATTEAEYAALQRATQYAHYTPESVIRAMWRAAEWLGFTGGRVLEPGMGTGLFFALMPDRLCATTRLTGVEYDPVSARIAALLHPAARIRREDYTRSRLAGGFDLVIGNPPFADRVVRADAAVPRLGLRLHDYFIARSISRLRPGGLALFVTSTGTMDKANATARAHIAGMADLLGAVRLPEGSMNATAGTQVVVDILVFQRRPEGQVPVGPALTELAEIRLDDASWAAETDLAAPGSEDLDEGEPTAGPDALPSQPRRGAVLVKEYFAAHPQMVLGHHAQRRGIQGPGLAYTCRATAVAGLLEALIDAALAHLPAGIFTARPDAGEEEGADELDDPVQVGRAADGATIKEGSYLIGQGGRLCQISGGTAAPVAVKSGKAGSAKAGAGISQHAAKVIRALIPIRDALRAVLRAQASDRPGKDAQIRLRCAYSNFIRYYGPINHTVVSTLTDAETGEERTQHRRPNLAHFADDPDCWLVASIEHYDADSGIARMGPVFSQRVISPPAEPLIASPADALAITLAEIGRVDPELLAALLECPAEDALAQLGAAVFRNPATEQWETADAFLSLEAGAPQARRCRSRR
jgi:hypothetical protein